jgi:hypothetical protein
MKEARDCGGLSPQPSVGPMAIVVIDEDSDCSFEMLTIQDEQPVETFVLDGSHETFGDGIRLRRYPKRRAHDLNPFCSKHLVETRREPIPAGGCAPAPRQATAVTRPAK